MELFVSRRPNRLDISISDDNSWSPDVLDTWVNQAMRAIITLDHAARTGDDAT